MGGQTVDLRDGRVYVDGVLQDEPYTRGEPSYPLTPYYGLTIDYPYTVPEGGLWVMGTTAPIPRIPVTSAPSRSRASRERRYSSTGPLTDVGPL